MCQQEKRFSPLRVIRENILVTIIFSSLFSIKKISLLPVDVGTLLNHVKSGVSWFLVVISFFYLLAGDPLQSFCCRADNSVFLYCLIGDRSQHYNSEDDG